MTVVAIRDGIIATDTAAGFCNLSIKVTKLRRQANVAIGFAGSFSDASIFADWYFDKQDSESLPKFHNRGDAGPQFSALVLMETGWEFWDQEFFRDTDMQQNPFMAIGSAAEVAMGAFYMGATAIQAVEAACAQTMSCALPVEYHEIRQAPSGLKFKASRFPAGVRK